jgi:group I intron endonuclease
MAYIYKISNDVNGKFYIGKTNGSSLVRRWKEHQRTALDKSYRHPLYDGIRHHGLESFSIETLEECDTQLLDTREKFWISKLRPPYNLTEGGEGGDTFTHKPEHMKEQTRKKLSLASKKRWSNRDYRQLMSRKAKEKAQDPEYIRKLSNAGKKLAQDSEYLKKVSDGVKNAISTRKDIWSECKKGSKNGRWIGNIEMYDIDKNLYKVFESAVECRRHTGLVAHYIRQKAKSETPVLRGKFAGYTFKLNKI